MSSYLFTTSFWSQQLIVSLQGYITMQLTLILTLIMPPCTPLFVRKLSPTVSFSAYGACAVTRQILKITAKKCFFPDAVATCNGLLVKPAIELWLISEPHGNQVPSLWCWHTTLPTRWSRKSSQETCTWYEWPWNSSNLSAGTYATPLSGAPLITLQLSLSGHLYDAFQIREKGNIERCKRGCRQSLYRGTKNFWQHRWKTYMWFLTSTQNIQLVLCATPKSLEPQ